MAEFSYPDLSPYIQSALQEEQRMNIANSPAGRLAAQIQQANLMQAQQELDPNSPKNQLALAIQRAQLQNQQGAFAEQQLRLRELQNPQLAAQRKIDNDVLEAILQGKNPYVTFAPQVSPEIAAARKIAEEQAGIPSTAYEGGDFIQISPASGNLPARGFSRSIGDAAKIKEREAKRADLQAKADAAGVPGIVRFDADGNPQFLPTKAFGGQAPVMPDAKFNPTGSRGGGGLTPNQQNTILRKASNAGINPDDPKYYDPETEKYDFTRIAIDEGKAARENKARENQLKAQGLTGKMQSDVAKLDAGAIQLDSLRDKMDELALSGKAPGFKDNFIAAITAAPPDGTWETLKYQTLKYFQSKESKDLEGNKGIISSALRSAISGLAVSKEEATNLGWLPRPSDSFGDLIGKVALVELYIKNQRAGLTGGSTSAPAPGVGAPPPKTAEEYVTPKR